MRGSGEAKSAGDDPNWIGVEQKGINGQSKRLGCEWNWLAIEWN